MEILYLIKIIIERIDILMADSKIKSAEIKYIFNQTEKAKSVFIIKYEDGSIKKGEGIQVLEEADKFLEDLKDHPIYIEPTDNIQNPTT